MVSYVRTGAFVTSILHRDPDDMVRVLDENGTLVDDATEPDLSDEELRDMYRTMKLSRHFDRRAVSLQRQGRMGTYPPLAGQEAAQVASAMALEDGDWVFRSYREHASALVRGVPLEETLVYWMGNEAGNAVEEGVTVFPVAVPIASQIPHAVGTAWAAKLAGDDAASIVYFGDGATSEGDFHEGMNFAGVFDVPTVFFCNNNQWAISMPRERQTASETIAQKADAYGFEGVQVDGMDPLAVYRVTREVIGKAKEPTDEERRPTLVEAVQYRFGAHTTSDDPSVYRDEEEVERWMEKDPIPRLETYLLETGRLTESAIEEVDEWVETQVADAIEAAENHPRPAPKAMFESAYDEMPDRVREQYRTLETLRETYGDDALLEES